MKVIFWAPTLPRIVEAVSREAGRGAKRFATCLQLDPAAKTVDYSAAQLDEVLRTEISNIEALERALVGPGKAFVVLDLWGLLFVENFEAWLEFLPRLAARAAGLVVLAPRQWSGAWRGHPICRQVSQSGQGGGDTLAVFEMCFGRSKQVFEALWNARGSVTLLESAPTFELSEQTCGHHNLTPLKRWGVEFLPSDCHLFPSRFARYSALSRIILELVQAQMAGSKDTPLQKKAGAPGLSAKPHLPQRPTSTYQSASEWLESVPAEVVIWGKQGKRFLMRCSWETYCASPDTGMPAGGLAFQATSGLSAGIAVRATRSQKARWVHFLAVLEHQHDASAEGRQAFSGEVAQALSQPGTNPVTNAGTNPVTNASEATSGLASRWSPPTSPGRH